MAKKPIHLEQGGGRGNRQVIWEAIRKQRNEFSRISIERETKIDVATVKTYLNGLEKAGFIEQTGGGVSPGARNVRLIYRMLKDVGVEAPKVSRDGNVLPPSLNESLWRTMRILDRFSWSELAMHAATAGRTISAENAKTYCRFLALAGYLIVVEAGHGAIGSKKPKQTKYRLNPSKYTGPRPPMIQRTKSVYDPNVGKIVYTSEPDHDAA